MDLSTKTELVRSFAGFNSTTVSEGHVRLARRCLEAIQPRSARYEHVPFHMILQWNQVHTHTHSHTHKHTLTLHPGESQQFQYDCPSVRPSPEVRNKPPKTQAAAGLEVDQDH